MKMILLVISFIVSGFFVILNANEDRGNITIMDPDKIDSSENSEMIIFNEPENSSMMDIPIKNFPGYWYHYDPRIYPDLCLPINDPNKLVNFAKTMLPALQKTFPNTQNLSSSEVKENDKNFIVRDVKKVVRDHFVPGQIKDTARIYGLGAQFLPRPPNSIGWAYCIAYRAEKYNSIRLWGNPNLDLSIYIEMPYGSKLTDKQQIYDVLKDTLKYDGEIYVIQSPSLDDPDYIIYSPWCHLVGKAGSRQREIKISQSDLYETKIVFYWAIRVKFFFSEVPQKILNNDAKFGFVYEDKDKGHGNDEDRIDEDNPGRSKE